MKQKSTLLNLNLVFSCKFENTACIEKKIQKLKYTINL